MIQKWFKFELNSNLDYFSIVKNCRSNLFKCCIIPGVQKYCYFFEILPVKCWPFPSNILWIVYLPKEFKTGKGLTWAMHWASSFLVPSQRQRAPSLPLAGKFYIDHLGDPTCHPLTPHLFFLLP